MPRTAVLLLALASSPVYAQDSTWDFQPERDTFSKDARFDLRSLNEDQAGQTGWIRVAKDGAFTLGNGKPVRFWAVGAGWSFDGNKRPRWREPGVQDAEHSARWLAKRGVNMIRLHGHINPTLPKDGPVPPLGQANQQQLEWIWRSIAAAKQAGVYTTVSPYWANTMASNDQAWGTQWNGAHHGLLFFDPQLQAAYKAWLKQLFTTATPLLGGKTLAKEPAMAIFQIQNEDSLLFWTLQNLKPGPRAVLGQQLGAWAKAEHGSIDKALAAWQTPLKGDRPAEGILDIVPIWELTKSAHDMGLGKTRRHADTLRFLVETMRNFNTDIETYIHKQLACPVLVNAGNWKTADDILLNDLERYSYTSNQVSAVNRYYGGVHKGQNEGWAVVNGDAFVGDSVTKSNPLGFPINLKQPLGQAMLVTESSWVFPSQYAAEAPLLIASYSSLTGLDAYYWFNFGTEEWAEPRSANGYMPSQEKWSFATPDCLGQFPAAALMFRRGDVKTGIPVLVEHRGLNDMYNAQAPLLHEISGFDPNRDAEQAGPGVANAGSVDPFAYFVGPVQVVYEASPKPSVVSPDINKNIQHLPGGSIVRSNTGELLLNTKEGFASVDTPRAQGVTGHFAGGKTIALSDVTFTSSDAHSALIAISLDDRPLRSAKQVLVQAGTLARPTGWKTSPTQIKLKERTIAGERIDNYGTAPWQVATCQSTITIANKSLRTAKALDANGLVLADVPLEVNRSKGTVSFSFPSGTLYVVLE